MLVRQCEIQLANFVHKIRRKLRIFVSHTVNGQPWQEGGADNFEAGREAPGWTFRIEGRLLDVRCIFWSIFLASSPIIQSALPRLNKGSPRKFSTFLKSMIVEFDRDPTLYPDLNVVEVRFVIHS